MATTTQEVGASLKALRELAGMTLSDIAINAETSISYLSRVENGIVTPTGSYVARVTQTIATKLAA